VDDYGIILLLPESLDERRDLELLLPDPDEIDELLVSVSRTVPFRCRSP